MSGGAVTRKLTAILYADVAGYSRLTGEDEVSTHLQLAAGLDLISQSVRKGDGRVVHYAGDAVLAEFSSVVAAVQTAVSIQRALEKHSVELPEDKRLTFRIGVNFGEVIVDRDEIYGDGVNVAARLEERAPPGGICISGRVHSDIRGKIDVGIVDLGDQELKNIAEPMRVYRVLTGPDSGSGALRQASSRKKLNRAAAVAAAIVAVIGTALWLQTSGPDPTLQATAKPSIAVLPFTNSNSDTKDDFFSDGVANDIINDLSRFQNLLVIASNSVSAYKGKTVDLKTVSRELGVRYVLEGNVLRRGERVRINVQLTDATTGQHLWAERYDQVADNIWDIQDEITSRRKATGPGQINREPGSLRIYAKRSGASGPAVAY
jgi:TolB-like protein/class 3 adenylate cyclase